MYIRMYVRTCVCWPYVRDVIHKCMHVEQCQAHVPYLQALHLLTYVHTYVCVHCASLPAVQDDSVRPKVEEEAELDEGKIKEATDSGEMLSRVQELEDELKNSEWTRMDLTQENMTLGNHLKLYQEQKDHTEQENASLKKRLVYMLSSQEGGGL